MSGENTALVTIRQDLEKAMPKLGEVAPKHMSVDRLVRILLSACSRNPKLLECSRESVLTFCMKCSETGLEPIGAGGAWPVPYKNKNGTIEMQFIPDYRGLVNCAKRAGCITDAYAEVVRECDEFDYSLGLAPTLTHKPANKDRGDMINAYCVFTLADGTKRFVVMDAEEIEGIRKRSRASDFGPWKTDESEMWKKTVVRRAMKPFAGMSPALDAAIEADNASTGIVLSREPIPMPKAKQGEAHEASQTVTDMKPTRDELISEINDLIKTSKATKLDKVFAAVGLNFKEGEAWEMSEDDTLITLRSLLKA